MSEDVSFGKRVLVEFGGQTREGYVIEIFHDQLDDHIKDILRVLDEEAVINEELLALAEWMADYYSYPIAWVLDLMVPGLLRKQKAEVYVAGIDEKSYQDLAAQGIVLNQALFTHLFRYGEIKKSAAEKLSKQEELEFLIKAGYIIRSGSYQVRRVTDPYLEYTSGPAEYDLEQLKKRAPRQAEALQYIHSRGKASWSDLSAHFSRYVLEALLDKKYIQAVYEGTDFQQTYWQLNHEQEDAIQAINRAVDEQQSRQILLYGVTGSGKTEVYLQSAIHTLQQGKGVLILIPEIALTRQLVEVFSKRISSLAVLHSAMSAGERYLEWMRIKNGEARLVLGPRSAVFAPIENLGLIVLDEEQETSFKQEEMPRYHTREVAAARSTITGAALLMGSATPSIETYYQASKGEMQLLKLNQRIGTVGMPRVSIEDMRVHSKKGGTGLLSTHLKTKIAEKLASRQQVILFINRRGYSPMTICRECGTIATCPRCSVGMTYHKDTKQHLCHYCNYRATPKRQCEKCGSHYLQLAGIGTQKVEEEIIAAYPQARVRRLDLDSSRRKGVQKTIIKDMMNGNIDILIGTQMVAKGLDFPAVSLVGVIDADSMLNLPDFRAAERCFQLLVQAAGRAGRSDTPGEVVIQTYQPDHPVILLAAEQDYPSFYRYELSRRQLLQYPPFTHILRIVISARNERLLKNYVQEFAVFIEELLGANEGEFWILGPAPCPIQKINKVFRYQILLKSSSLPLLQSANEYIYLRKRPQGIRLEQDLNPIATM